MQKVGEDKICIEVDWSLSKKIIIKKLFGNC